MIMAKLRVLQIVGSEGKEQLKILPGTYNNDRECAAAITEEGEYAFLEVHLLAAADEQEEEEEEQTPVATPKRKRNGKKA